MSEREIAGAIVEAARRIADAIFLGLLSLAVLHLLGSCFAAAVSP